MNKCFVRVMMFHALYLFIPLCNLSGQDTSAKSLPSPAGLFCHYSGMDGIGDMYFFSDRTFVNVKDDWETGLVKEEGIWKWEKGNSHIGIFIHSRITAEGKGDCLGFPPGINRFERYIIREERSIRRFSINWAKWNADTTEEIPGQGYSIDAISRNQYNTVKGHSRDLAEAYSQKMVKAYINSKKRREDGELY